VSVIDRIFPRKSGPPGSPAPPAQATGTPRSPAAPAAAQLASGGGAPVAPADLLERRTKLAEELATLQWDLGGLTYEMAIRDHFRLDVLVRIAARLQEVDAELGEVERLLRMEESGAAGSCPSCGALHGRGSLFCWQCGTQLMATASPEFHQPVTDPSHPAAAANR
jgi:hypothetical protein